MSIVGAPVGNKNAARGTRWRDAIDRALDKVSRAESKEALDEIAEKLVREAMAGNAEARREIGDRLDGKAIQRAELTGPDGSALLGQDVADVRRKVAAKLLAAGTVVGLIGHTNGS